MTGQLDSLFFLPPPSDTAWSGAPQEDCRLDCRRADGVDVAIDLPLFWYDPPWCTVNNDTADCLATLVAETGVLVSALGSDLAGAERRSRFHGGGEEPSATEPASLALPRMVPYRPERYGLQASDFDGARVIDVRLTMSRDVSGRFAFSPEQIARWESTPAGEPLAGGSWVPAATFPPDVVSMEHLASKLNQLRVLAPEALVLVSIGPYRLEAELPRLLAAMPDGVILCLDQISLDGLQLAALTKRTRDLMDHAGASGVPLWVVPGEISADDAVKLIALGAAAIGVDAWCDPLLTDTVHRRHADAAARLGYHANVPIDKPALAQAVESRLAVRVERFRGLRQSLQYARSDQQLGTFSSSWAKLLDVVAVR